MKRKVLLFILSAGLASSLLLILPSCANNPAPGAPVTIMVGPVTILVTATATITTTVNPSQTPAAFASWTTNGSLGVGVSGSHVWVGDAVPALEVFTLGGAPITTIGLGYYATGIVPDGSGGVYVSGSCNNTIVHVTNSFALGVSFSTAHCSDGLAVDASGNFYTTAAFDASNLVQKYSSAGVSLTSWTVPGGNPFGIAIAGSPQTLYVASQTNKLIYTFDLNGNALSNSWSINGDGSSLAVDGLGRLYVGGYNSSVPMQRFSLDGTLQTQWGSFQSAGIAFDGSNNIYIGSLSTLQVFTP